ncbi:MAG: bifunctional ADP-dependent NAD(P)H-hydrate dehydratase/NAD(P)H-hydrate epimerase [Treponema sp.]|jgi:NAD(P)H-hydrate epimerase|nr:bifunctional ADP-dependent NAD(P)H-hydrate dehydratase/NAD(P)H-hydrate epimerase [Treponema sp.]
MTAPRRPKPPCHPKLFSAQSAQALDKEASSAWGLNPFALVEAAGRNCALRFVRAFPGLFSAGVPRIAVAAGSGNNGADAMVMLRALILGGHASPETSTVVVKDLAQGAPADPRSEALRSLKALGVPLLLWEEELISVGTVREGGWRDGFTRSDIIIDGIVGTGLKGPLQGAAAEIVHALNGIEGAFIAAIDVPSGNFDSWKPGMPIIRARATLAVEPVKRCLYSPAARIFGGTIVPVGEIFPPALINSFEGPELITWQEVQGRIPRIPPDAYKHQRGVLEIRAGSPGFSGAPRIAARGAQAAGAGLVRLVVDGALYPILAASAGGVMVVSGDEAGSGPDRFRPGAILLGPGWGRGADRRPVLERALEEEARGTPLVLDADAISLAKDRTFHGNAILTPHPGEFAAYTGVPKEETLAHPESLLTQTAREKGAVILYKGHVLFIAAGDGRLGVVDGMQPVLAAGGSGDLLAGICAALAARLRAAGGFDGYTCAVTAAALLLEACRAEDTARVFRDPLELADRVAAIAGAAWL